MEQHAFVPSDGDAGQHPKAYGTSCIEHVREVEWLDVLVNKNQPKPPTEVTHSLS